MEFRKIFDTIPEEFDKYRPRYSKELFDSLIDYAKIRPGKSVLAMMLVSAEYRSTNEALCDDIQKVYDQYFKPEYEYQHRSFHYDNAPNYGYKKFERRDFFGERRFTADEYVAFSKTHCDHLVIPEPYNTKFFDGLRSSVLAHGNCIIFKDTYVLYLAKK